MKKLLTILVICVLAVSLYAVDNPFTFSFSQQTKIMMDDQSQPGKVARDATVTPADKDTIGNSPSNDYKVSQTGLGVELAGNASITIAEIYTLGSYLKGYGEYGFGGDAYRINFSTGLTNSIKVIPDYLTIGINADWTVRWEARETKDATVTVAGTDYTASDVAYEGNQVEYHLTPAFTLGGSVPDSGFSWGFTEKAEMVLNPNNWKDSDPTYSTVDGNIYNSATGTVAGTTYNGLFNLVEFNSIVDLNWEFFHYFAPENITGTLSLNHNLQVQVPYSYYLEKDKRLRNEGQYGIKLGLAGVSVGIFAYLRTQDYLNSSAPLNGDLGSNWNWAGSTFTTPTGTWSDISATSHARGELRLGPRISFGYTKEWFSFGTQWTGYADNLRGWDESGQNGAVTWTNEFEVSATIKL